MRKKVLVIMYQDFSLEFGATRKYSEMMEYLTKYLDIILLCSRGASKDIVFKTYEVHIIPPRKKDLKNHSILHILLCYLFFYINQILLLFKILIVHRDLKYVHMRHDTYSIPSAIILFLFGKKVIADGKIFSSYALIFDNRLKYIKTFIIFIEKLVLKTYWKFYIYSINYKKELIKYGLNKNKLFYIPPSINLKKIPVDPINKSNMFNICYFGELHDYSNVSVLIKAFSLVKESFPTSRLYIIGDGECYASLVELAKKVSEDIVFTGHLHVCELFHQFNKFSIVVNPTQLFAGANSTKKIEALAAGKVILEAMPYETTGEFDDSDVIIYFDASNPHQLSGKICHLFKNPDLIYQYSAKSLELSKRYNIGNYKKLLDIMEYHNDYEERCNI